MRFLQGGEVFNQVEKVLRTHVLLQAGRHDEPLLDTARGVLYSRLNRTEKAEEAFRKALAKDPAALPPMEELFVLYDRQGKVPRLIPELRAAIRKEEGSFMHHNWLGLIAKRRGDLKVAEAEFHRALAIAPDLVGVMANLGSLLLQQERAGEAVELLTRALEKEPRNLESRTNLIVALGMTHDLAGAAGRVAEAKAMGQRAPHLYNALAYALYINGQQDKAMAALKESLKIDPRQPDALRLRAEIEQGQPVAASPYR